MKLPPISSKNRTLSLERISALFYDCARLIRNYQSYWRVVPFYDAPLDWQSRDPEFANSLQALDDQQIHEAELQPFENSLTQSCRQYRSFVAEIRDCIPAELLTAESIAAQPLVQHHSHFRGIPGRKRQQIGNLLHCLQHELQQQPSQIVDWCGGKGHLGKVAMLQFQSKLTVFEKNEKLCQQGQKLVAQFLPEHKQLVSFRARDVLADDLRAEFPVNSLSLALHACGQLNLELLKLVAELAATATAIAPCCYHRIATPFYMPLSQQMQSWLRDYPEMNLSRKDLQLATTEQARANDKALKHRTRWLTYRMALYLWRKQADESLVFKPLGRFHPSLTGGPFLQYCESIAEIFNFELPSQRPKDFTALLAKAAVEVRQRRALALPRFLFRRVLELLLVCDRALFLGEAGYEVTVQTFAPFSVTPRNLLIVAQNRR